MKGLWGVEGSNGKDFERAQYNECKKQPALRVKRSSYNFHEIKTGHITEDWELVDKTATLEATRTVE